MRIAHLTADHNHVRNAKYLFESVSLEKHTFFVLETSDKLKSNHMLSDMFDGQFEQAEFYSVNTKESVLPLLETYDLIIVHSLSKHNIAMLNQLDTSASVVMWKGWGYDYIDLLFDSFSDVLEPASKALYFALKSQPSSVELPHVIDESKKSAIQKVDIFCPVIEQEYIQVQSRHPFTRHMQYIEWRYGFEIPIEKIKDIASSTPKLNQVWVGNSATITNNHIDYIDYASSIDELRVMEHFFPMSYGYDNYKLSIRDKLQSLMGDSAHIIEGFVPLDEYIGMIAKSRFMVMTHLRQQAMGNIWIGLLSGAKIFFNETSLVYQFFKQNGYYVYPIASIRDEVNQGELPNTAKTHNANLAVAMFSEQMMKRRTHNLVDMCQNIKHEKLGKK